MGVLLIQCGVTAANVWSRLFCCAHIFTETRLHPSVPDPAAELDRWTVFQADGVQDCSEGGLDLKGATDKEMLATSW